MKVIFITVSAIMILSTPSIAKLDKRSIAIQWEGKDSLIAGSVTLGRKGGGKIDFSIPGVGGQCSGIFSRKNKTEGVWSAACTSGENASGTYSVLGPSKGAVGYGYDQDGKAIKFTVSAKLAPSPKRAKKPLREETRSIDPQRQAPCTGRTREFNNCFGTADYRGGKSSAFNRGTYAGWFVGGRPHGRGRYETSQFIYEGDFINGRPTGKGKMSFSNGNSYVGNFGDQGKPHGKGEEKFYNGDHFIGEYRHGFKQEGTYTFASGCVHTGSYRNQRKDGPGAYNCPDGRQYIGNYKNDKPHGIGTATLPGNRRYEGHFFKGVPHGKGLMKLPNGKVLNGNWSNGKFLGSNPEEDTYGPD